MLRSKIEENEHSVGRATEKKQQQKRKQVLTRRTKWGKPLNNMRLNVSGFFFWSKFTIRTAPYFE